MRRVRRHARRGRHHEPDPDRRLPRGHDRAHRRDPEGAPLELPRGRLHRRDRDARTSPRSRRSTTCRSSTTSGSGLLAPGTGMPRRRADGGRGPRRRRRPRDVLGRQAARRPTGGARRRAGPTLVAKLRRHPIARAVRVDKMQIAALEPVLAMYATGDGTTTCPSTGCSASRPGRCTSGRSVCARRSAATSRTRTSATLRVGGGRRVDARDRARLLGCARDGAGRRPAFAARLRAGSPSVFCRVEDDHVLFDCADGAPTIRCPTSPGRSCTRSRATSRRRGLT